jgi:hypothetical protein
VSLALLGVVLVRHVGLNAFNGWTIFVGIAGGVIAITCRQAAALVLAFGLVLVAMLPAMFGGLGLLYLPSLLLTWPLRRRTSARL